MKYFILLTAILLGNQIAQAAELNPREASLAEIHALLDKNTPTFMSLPQDASIVGVHRLGTNQVSPTERDVSYRVTAQNDQTKCQEIVTVIYVRQGLDFRIYKVGLIPESVKCGRAP